MILAARERAIVPTLSGLPLRPQVARLVPGVDVVWLPAASFPEVALIRDSKEKEFFSELGVPQLSNVELRKRLVELKSLSIEERALLISGLIKNNIEKSVHSSSLLLDNNSNQVPDSA